jgi:hypothetical protein
MQVSRETETAVICCQEKKANRYKNTILRKFFKITFCKNGSTTKNR